MSLVLELIQVPLVAVIIINSEEMTMMQFASSNHSIQQIGSFEGVVMDFPEGCLIIDGLKVKGRYGDLAT